MTIWHDMSVEQPPKDAHVIGILLHAGNDDTGVICGTLYDLRDGTIMDWRRGRWLCVSHWAYPPGSEPEEKLKPKYGELGFTFPACDQCRSTSLRCGCD